MSLSGKKILVILRHANSLQIVQEFVAQQGGESIPVALDPIEAPQNVASALESIRNAAPQVDMVVMGTKVYDPAKEGPSRLMDLLGLLKSYGVGQKPICLTHLQTLTLEALDALKGSGLNLFWAENDNLKRDRMNNLGPIMIKAI